MFTLEKDAIAPRFIRAVQAKEKAEQFLAGNPDLLDRIFVDGSPVPELGLAHDQTETAARAGSAKKYRTHNLWYDGEQAFVLTHRDKPVAAVAFHVGFRMDYFRIQQIQGVRGAKILYQLGRWEHALVRLVESYTEATETAQTQILPASKNFWVNEYLKRIEKTGVAPENGLAPEKAKKRYDDVAVKLGYSYDEALEVFIKRWPFGSAVC